VSQPRVPFQINTHTPNALHTPSERTREKKTLPNPWPNVNSRLAALLEDCIQTAAAHQCGAETSTESARTTTDVSPSVPAYRRRHLLVLHLLRRRAIVTTLWRRAVVLLLLLRWVSVVARVAWWALRQGSLWGPVVGGLWRVLRCWGPVLWQTSQWTVIRKRDGEGGGSLRQEEELCVRYPL